MKNRVAAIALLATGLGGCAVVQEKTFGESLDEASASSQIKARLLSKGGGRFKQVDVEVTSRLVLLTGRVDNEEDKVAADQIAWSVRTIDEVANEIEVIPKTKILENLNDEWITAKLRSRLVGDAEIKSVNYNIETFNGVVYLLGYARNQTELKRTAEHASLIKGVKRVVSYVKMRDRSLPPGYTAETGPPPGYNVPPAPIETAPAVSQYPNSQPYNGQVGYVDPNPPQEYDDSGLYGGVNDPVQSPYIDPADSNARYDADGYLIETDQQNTPQSSDAYSDPYSDPFGDNGSYN